MLVGDRLSSASSTSALVQCLDVKLAIGPMFVIARSLEYIVRCVVFIVSNM